MTIKYRFRERNTIHLDDYVSRDLTKKVRIIVWRAVFGVKCLENPWKRKIFNFFEATGKFPYFDMLKNGSRGSNRSGVRKSFQTRIVRVPKQLQENLNNVVVKILIN